ncbi:uncharacterized protein V6R79_009042 [Siganus canaliculatus]
MKDELDGAEMMKNSPVKVKVKEGDDVVLPCSLGQTDLRYQIFDWTKVKDVEDKTQKEVFLYDAGIHYNNGRTGQDPQFKGRVSHFKDELQRGNASIKIQNTKLEDRGKYKCIFPNLQDQIFRIELVVGAAPEPSLTTVDETADRALLQCSVKGAFPEPTVEWKNSAGEVLPSVVTLNSEVNKRFDITLQTNVTQTGFYNCVVTQDDIGHQVYSVTFERFGPVVVDEGSDVVLPCSLGQTDLTNQVFEWKKDGQEVFYYDAGKHHNNGRGGQDPKFKGRVSHFEDELKHGNASIKIRNTKLEDSGDYSCAFPNLQNQIFHIKLAFVLDKRNIDGANTGLIAGLTVVSILFVVVVSYLAKKNHMLKHSLRETNGGHHPPSELVPLPSN